MSSPSIHDKYQEALVPGKPPLAEYGLNVFQDGTESLIGKLVINHEPIRTFLEEQGVDRTYFQQPLIHIQRSLDPNQDKQQPFEIGASISISDISFNDQTYFPYIQLGVDVDDLDIKQINHNFRHELGHFVNADTTKPLYNKPAATSTTRLVGMSAFTYNFLPEAPAYPTTTQTLAATALGATLYVGGLFTTVFPIPALHMVTPREIRANHFARKHRGFNPISLNE